MENYAIELNGEFLVLNEEGTEVATFATFEEAVTAEADYPDYDTQIIDY